MKNFHGRKISAQKRIKGLKMQWKNAFEGPNKSDLT